MDINLVSKRCAIYTRKSTNARLDHEVNSLVTQREICSAYIKSQQYKGWIELPERYDDGGQSGSGLDRPALVRLMQDIENGKVDIVVVYKIDRLTRSLFDFVRLIESLDRRKIALVSISQAFDTSDSMGRMILNILLTFSQFERELIAERARDGIRTRKRHGKIHGGRPPFGYVATPNGIEIDEKEADIVRFIFAEFLRTRRYAAVMRAVREADCRSSLKRLKNGEFKGGKPMSAGAVYSVLQNPMYIGEIKGHEQNYRGEHQPIISAETWEAAQALRGKRKRRSYGSRGTGHFLTGLLRDDLGRHMILDVNWYRDKAYCAYASSNAYWAQKQFQRAYRANAKDLDRFVMAATLQFFCDRRALRRSLKHLGVVGPLLEDLAARGEEASERLQSTPKVALEDLFSALLYGVEVAKESLTLEFRPLEVRRFLEWADLGAFQGSRADWPFSDARYEYVVEVRAVTAERWPSLHIKPRDEKLTAIPDPNLVALIKKARKARQIAEEHRDWSVKDLAKEQGCAVSMFARLIRVNYLAPDIVMSILDGSQPQSLKMRDLMMSNIPTDWALQRQLYGFPTPTREISRHKGEGNGMWRYGQPSSAE